MHSISDERNWLTWLVKVRMLILMVLLVIELAVIRLTPSPVPSCLFLPEWCCGPCSRSSFFFWFQCGTRHRLQAILQVLADLAMVTLVVEVDRRHRELAEFSLSARYRGRMHVVAAKVGHI